MHCEAPKQKEVDWDALWRQREKDRQKQYWKENKERLKEYKKKYNEEHQEKIKEYQKKYWSEYQKAHKEQRNKIVRKSQRKRRAAAREKGMCIQCCIGIPAPGRKSCPKCLERAREYARMKRAEKKSTI